MKYIGIDPDLNGSIVVIEDCVMIDYKRIIKIPNPTKSPKNIIDEKALYGDIHYLAEKHGIELCYIEEPFCLAGKGTAPHSQGRTYGGIRMALVAHGIKIITVKPSKWKKVFNLQKKTKRDSIAAATAIDGQFKGTLVKHNSLCESFLIGLYGSKFLK